MTISPVGQIYKISYGQITIDPERFTVQMHGSYITLTKTEFLILYLVLSTKGKIHTRSDIARYALGSESLKHSRTIDTHICNIRKKFGKVKDLNVITAIKGVGYKLNDSMMG
jgi:DNA-binding response OmpR family regulator